MLRFNSVVLEISRVFLSQGLQSKEIKGGRAEEGGGGGGVGWRHKAQKNYLDFRIARLSIALQLYLHIYNIAGSLPGRV